MEVKRALMGADEQWLETATAGGEVSFDRVPGILDHETGKQEHVTFRAISGILFSLSETFPL